MQIYHFERKDKKENMLLRLINAQRQTTEMAGKLQAPSACRNRIAQKEQECLFQPVGTKKAENLGRSLVCSGKFLIELRVPFAFKLVEPEISARGFPKMLRRFFPDFGTMSKISENVPSDP